MKKKKRRFRVSIKKISIWIIVIGGIILFHHFVTNKIENGNVENGVNINSKYSVIKQDVNSNYLGIGQENVKNQDGYFTTFTTIETNKKVYKEYKQNGTSSWAKNNYWGGTMEENGCGITALSIILSGYDKNYTPEDLRKKYSPVLKYENMSKELKNTFGIENSDFYYDSVHLSKEKLEEHLKTNRPILICVWNKPKENRWTTSSHYMVLLATDEKEKVYISNPNGLENDSKSSGWYDFEEVTPFIAKALYVEKYD